MKRVRIALSGAGGYGGFYLPYLLENKWNLPMSSWAWWSRNAGRVAACRTCEAHGREGVRFRSNRFTASGRRIS